MVSTVAPRAGAWIETMLPAPNSASGLKSHPVRVRGLKLRGIPITAIADQASHPVRVRGLKQDDTIGVYRPLIVAPRAGAWIETRGL